MRGEGGKTVGRRLPGALSHLGWSPCTSAISAKRRLELIPLSGLAAASSSPWTHFWTIVIPGLMLDGSARLYLTYGIPVRRPSFARAVTPTRLPLTLPERTHTRTYLYRTHCTNHTRRCTRRRRSMPDVRHTART